MLMNFTLCGINNEVLQEACVCLVRAFSIRLGHQQLAGYKCSPKIQWLEPNYPSFLSAESCQRRTVMFSRLVRLPGLQVYPLENTSQQVLRCFGWRGTMVRKEDALVQNTESSPHLESVSSWLRGYPSTSLSFSFIRGR